MIAIFGLFLFIRSIQDIYVDEAFNTSAIEHGVSVRLLSSHWNFTRPVMALARYLASWEALSGLNIDVIHLHKLTFTIYFLKFSDGHF